MSEFDCEGCGAHVFALGRARVPRSGFCALCEWLCEFVPDPQEMMDLRARIGPAETVRRYESH